MRGITFIFTMLHLPNQENKPDCHFCRSFLMSLSKGGKLKVNTSSTFFGKRMPKYLIQESAHLKGKSACSSLANEFGMDMFRASDFWKLTLKLDNLPYALSSDIKLGMEIRGLDIKKEQVVREGRYFGRQGVLQVYP